MEVNPGICLWLLKSIADIWMVKHHPNPSSAVSARSLGSFRGDSARTRAASGSGHRRAIRHSGADRRSLPSHLSGRIAPYRPSADEEGALGATFSRNGETASGVAL